MNDKTTLRGEEKTKREIHSLYEDWASTNCDDDCKGCKIDKLNFTERVESIIKKATMKPNKKGEEKKLYLTKSRKKRLHNELSINDILYRTFEQMQERIDKYARHLNKTYKNVVQVRSKDFEGNFYIEQIIDVQKIDGEGLVITVHRWK